MKYLIIACLLLCSCMTEQKATDYLVSRNKLAGICNKVYPAKSIYLPGTAITVRDTSFLPGDSVPCPPTTTGKETIIKWVKCPDQIIIRDTTTRVDTFYDPNIRAIQEYQFQLGNKDAEILYLKSENEKETSKKVKWRNAALSGWGLIIMGLIIFFYLGFVRKR